MKVLSTISASLMLATSFTVAQNANADTVHLQKATTDFAIDGNRGSNGEGQQVYLFDANRNNVNQQWTEHDRGRGYYSYQKVRTSLCLDGGNGGANGQRVILFECNDSNQNQHWRKISTGNNSYRLEKRNAPNFSIDGNRGATVFQGVFLWNSNSRNVNQQWVFSTIGGTISNCNTVDSLSELRGYLSRSNQCVQMAPGTYTFDSNNTGSNELFSDPSILRVTGNNNTFHFDDVTFRYDTENLRAFGREEVRGVHVVGNNNTLYNLTMVDIGNERPTFRAQAVVLDGIDNTVDGFDITTSGSFPYGYGDIFGKGGGSVIGHNKHSGILIRGESIHLKDTRLLMRSYGHGVFMQGAINTLIEGVHVEGELSTVNAVLAEEGSGSPADEVNFRTVWGFDLRDHNNDYRFSLQEDGIRGYRAGQPANLNEPRNTANITVLDSTVKFMRSGVTLGLSGGSKYVENVTAVGTESGFWVGNDGVVVDSRGDTSVGPLYSEDGERNGSRVELTILENEVSKIGNTPALYLAGSNHEFTFKDGTRSVASGITIQVGGIRYGHRWFDGTDDEPPPNRNANNIEINNQSPYRLSLERTSSNTTGSSCGPITDNGSRNDVRQECN